MSKHAILEEHLHDPSGTSGLKLCLAHWIRIGSGLLHFHWVHTTSGLSQTEFDPDRSQSASQGGFDPDQGGSRLISGKSIIINITCLCIRIATSTCQ